MPFLRVGAITAASSTLLMRVEPSTRNASIVVVLAIWDEFVERGRAAGLVVLLVEVVDVAVIVVILLQLDDTPLDLALVLPSFMSPLWPSRLLHRGRG